MIKKRQLAAIMFTDIVGYTSLMQKDEAKGYELRRRHREIFEEKTSSFNGHILQYFGDGTLSVFQSSVEAVECAIDMQRLFLNELDIPVRIGIHVGDILYSDDDIVGDAVNIASRIESCAIGGSIVISDKVNDHIRSHKHIKSNYVGVIDFKNVEDSMPLFTIANDGLRQLTKEQLLLNSRKPRKDEVPKSKISWQTSTLVLALIAVISFALYFIFKNQPSRASEFSIAVLPFDNLSTDPNDEIFGDGMTEEILTSLTRLKELHVISKTSILQYKNTNKSAPQIAKELGVTYILEGSIRKIGDKIRVTAQLINAIDDEHIWAEQYDRTITDIFSIQSDVSKEIVNALELNISLEEESGLVSIPTQDLEAYRYFLRGKQEADQRSSESINRSIDFYEQAIQIDNEFAEAYAEIANSIFLTTYYSRANPEEAMQKAQIYLEKAEQLDPNLPRVYTVKGLLYNHAGQFDKAKTAFEKAIYIAPNDVTARHQYATYFFYTQQYEKQLEQTKIAYSLDPLSFATASAYFSALTYNEHYEEAEKFLATIEEKFSDTEPQTLDRLKMRLYMASGDYKKAIDPLTRLSNEDTNYYRMLGYSYAQLGNTQKAYQIIDTIKKYGPERLRNHRLAVVFSGLNLKDSVYFYLDTIRNKTTLFNSDRIGYFNQFKKDSAYQKLLKEHGIQ